MKKVWILLVLVLGLGLQAMAVEPARTAEGIAPPKRIPDPVTNAGIVGATDPVSSASLPRELRRALVADAARYFNVPESQVVLARAEKVVWSDAALGCPQPDMVYAQATVDGYRVVARTAAREMVYHTNTGTNLVRCKETLPVRGQRPPDGAPGNDAQPRTQPPVPAAPDR
jgi:hypothetical protein